MGHNTGRYIELTLPLSVVIRELRIYNERQQKEIWPDKSTWPAARQKFKRTFDKKDLTKFVIKFKRRERWEMLKADLGSEYLERVHEASLQNIAQTGQSSNLNGHLVHH